jgi:hypothetical protein
MYTILSVAIGDPANNCLINSLNDPHLPIIRPYITGLINWLEKRPNPVVPNNSFPKYAIGTDYEIDYRECAEDQLAATFTVSNDIILCLSLTAARAAVKFTQRNNISDRPIVANVSNWQPENFPANVCGASAQRPDHITRCFNDFKGDFKGARQFYALNKHPYTPTDSAAALLGSDVKLINVAPTDSIQAIIHKIPQGSGGLLVLPADRFFAAKDDIVQWAEVDQKLLTFWTVTDWVGTGTAGPFGGSGFPQQTCGQYLAERIASIWSSANHITIPNPPWTKVDENWYVHKKNAKVAKTLKINLGKRKVSKRTRPKKRVKTLKINLGKGKRAKRTRPKKRAKK